MAVSSHNVCAATSRSKTTRTTKAAKAAKAAAEAAAEAEAKAAEEEGEEADPDDSATAAKTQLSSDTKHELDKIAERLGDDCVLLHRVDDCYQLYGERSTRWSNVLGLGQFESRCPDGFPVAQADNYIGELIRQSVKVAVVDRTHKRHRRALGRSAPPRDVVRIVTPGTYLGSHTSTSASTHTRHLMCISPPFESSSAGDASSVFGVAYCDVSTGAVRCAVVPQEELARAVRAIAPAEIVLPESLLALAQHATHDPSAIVRSFSQLHVLLRDTHVTRRSDSLFRVEVAADVDMQLPFECRSALRGLARYLDETFVDQQPSLRKPAYTDLNTTLLDPSALKSLNVLRSSSGGARASLRNFMDHTCTKAGAKLLKARLAAPFHETAPIEARYNYIDLAMRDDSLSSGVDAVLQSLSKCASLDLVVQRILTAGD